MQPSEGVSLQNISPSVVDHEIRIEIGNIFFDFFYLGKVKVIGSPVTDHDILTNGSLGILIMRVDSMVVEVNDVGVLVPNVIPLVPVALMSIQIDNHDLFLVVS